MTVGDGVSVAGQFRNEVDELSVTTSVLSRASSRLSVASAASFLRHSQYNGVLSNLTQLISNHTALYKATIVATECYTQPIRLGVLHRFLMIELHRLGKKSIWLRLDRRRSAKVGAFRFVLSGGSTPANDTVRSRPFEPSETHANIPPPDSASVIKGISFNASNSAGEPPNIHLPSNSFSLEPTTGRYHRETCDL